MIARLWRPDPRRDVREALREANMALDRKRARTPGVDPFLVACAVVLLLFAAYALRV